MSYKFRIKELLKNLSKEEYDLAMKNLPTALGIHPVTFSNLINTRLDSDYMPNCNVMILLASFFNVPVESLFTIPPEKISIENIHNLSEKSTAESLFLNQ